MKNEGTDKMQREQHNTFWSTVASFQNHAWEDGLVFLVGFLAIWGGVTQNDEDIIYLQ